eukprot:CAMPEP_0196793506 /NCGR_PEP_ID=MMETSP1104-20130614/33088_1 /TAXON_ID=33652 /ORGANISM="Cafeteria sp., Strain Caron Lab Isolate" /LENGTH=198 /DNA_ID=CAMNT_0042163877 /DNA_START=11 /DNA_END=604 /DNA_ORIENTATION=-
MKRALQHRFVWETAFERELAFGALSLLTMANRSTSVEDAAEQAKKTYAYAREVADVTELAWTRVRAGQRPMPRQGSSGCPVGAFFLVHGGWTSGPPTLSNATFMFDTRAVQGSPSRRHDWAMLTPCGAAPHPTYGHRMTALDAIALQRSLATSHRDRPAKCYVLLTGGLLAGGYHGSINQTHVLELSLCPREAGVGFG